jgi:predicted dehydrogenase
LNIHQRSDQIVLSAAVVGAGVFGRHHATKYLRLPGVKLAAVADPSPQARLNISSHLHAPIIADWRDLLGRVDLVSVCSPASTHAEIVREFLAAGAHVLVEKPIATDMDEAEELIALAALRERVLTVGHQERFVFLGTGLFEYQEAPLAVECVRAGPWTGRGDDVSVVLDLMIHDIDLVHQLVPGAVMAARATGRSVHGQFADEVKASLIFRNGAKVELFASRVAESRQRSMRVVYADGEIEVDFLTRSIRNTTRRELRPLALQDPLAESVASFVAAARVGAMALVRPEEARRALETALRIEDVVIPANQRHAAGTLALRLSA